MKSDCIRCDYCGTVIKPNDRKMKFDDKDSCQLCMPFAFEIIMKGEKHG